MTRRKPRLTFSAAVLEVTVAELLELSFGSMYAGCTPPVREIRVIAEAETPLKERINACRRGWEEAGGCAVPPAPWHEATRCCPDGGC
jgi:hypothetical protein